EAIGGAVSVVVAAQGLRAAKQGTFDAGQLLARLHGQGAQRQHGWSNEPEIPARVVRPTPYLRRVPEVQLLDAGCDVHRVSRERRVDARVQDHVRVGNDVAIVSWGMHVADAKPSASPQPGRERSLGARGNLVAGVGIVEERIHAPGEAPRGGGPGGGASV